MPRSTENFVINHNLINNKFPKGVSLEEFGVNLKIKPKIDIEKFGLWDVSSPDFSSYYPEVTPEDLLPRDEDFIYPIFRGLSEVIVNKYGPIDFSKPGVLKASLKKLVGQTIYPNHDTNVGNELGTVVDVKWQEATKQSGINVPAGLNARLKLDGKSNPKIARGIMMDPPSVHSTSVGVTFEWDKSHPEMSDEDFWNKLGTIEPKSKELIRRVVTKIVAYHEISLVSHGADPYAQKVNDEGEINNPKYAKTRVVFSEDDFKKMSHYLDFKETSTFSMSSKLEEDEEEESTIPKKLDNETYRFELGNENNKPMKKELLEFLQAKFNMPQGTEEQLTAKLQERLPLLLQAETQAWKITSDELTALKAKYPEGSVTMTAEDKANLDKLKTLEVQMSTIVKTTREEAIKFYNLVAGGADKADKGVLKLIEDSNTESLFVLHAQYRKQADAIFTATCQDCNSTNVKRNSALGATPGTNLDNNEGGETKKKSSAEVVEELTNKAKITSVASIHGAPKKKEA